MSIKKQYLKKEPICKVTFRIKNEEGKKADDVKVVGDFNSWNEDCKPMKKLKSGEFTQTLKLETGKEYNFRYLFNNVVWGNEQESDKEAPTGIVQGENNSVLVV